MLTRYAWVGALCIGLTGCGYPPQLMTASPSSITSSPAAAHSAIAHPLTGLPEHIPRLVPEVLATYPLARDAFVEGLSYHDGRVLISTGVVGHSRLWWSTLTGETITSTAMPDTVFGEGSAYAGGSVWSLTWKAGVATAHDPSTLAVRARVHYDGQGWGLCSTTDGALWMSQGTPQLSQRDPHTFESLRNLTVTTGQHHALAGINELDCTDGQMWANVFPTSTMIRIDPTTGNVLAAAELASLYPPEITDREAVANGIARIPGTDRWLITGKRWGVIYEVRLTPTN